MILVIGDYILDEFCYGQVTRISPEAPNLVLDLQDVKRIHGGGYNVVEHLRSLGNKVRFATVVGTRAISKSDAENFFSDDDSVIFDPCRLATIKSRMVAKYRHTTLLRVDQESRDEISEDQQHAILEIAKNVIGGSECRAVCIIDYCKGMVTGPLASGIIGAAKRFGVKVFVDTKSRDIERYSGAYLIKPNKSEFSLLKSLSNMNDSTDENFCKYLYESLEIQNVLRTLGEDGLELYSRGEVVVRLEGRTCDVKELSGAGDSVLAGVVHLHSEGLSLAHAAERSNTAASIFVSEGVDYRLRKKDLDGAKN